MKERKEERKEEKKKKKKKKNRKGMELFVYGLLDL